MTLNEIYTKIKQSLEKLDLAIGETKNDNELINEGSMILRDITKEIYNEISGDYGKL